MKNLLLFREGWCFHSDPIFNRLDEYHSEQKAICFIQSIDFSVNFIGNETHRNTDIYTFYGLNTYVTTRMHLKAGWWLKEA